MCLYDWAVSSPCPEHTFTLDTVNNLGILYKGQGKMAEAEKMYQRVLEEKEKAWVR